MSVQSFSLINRSDIVQTVVHVFLSFVLWRFFKAHLKLSLIMQSICCIIHQNCPKTWVTCKSAGLYVYSSWFICKMSMWTGTRPALVFNKVYFFQMNRWWSVCLRQGQLCVWHSVYFVFIPFGFSLIPVIIHSVRQTCYHCFSVDPVLADLLSLNFSSTVTCRSSLLECSLAPKNN